jgi:hypothetical protein
MIHNLSPILNQYLQIWITHIKHWNLFQAIPLIVYVNPQVMDIRSSMLDNLHHDTCHRVWKFRYIFAGSFIAHKSLLGPYHAEPSLHVFIERFRHLRHLTFCLYRTLYSAPSVYCLIQYWQQFNNSFESLIVLFTQIVVLWVALWRNITAITDSVCSYASSCNSNSSPFPFWAYFWILLNG